MNEPTRVADDTPSITAPLAVWLFLQLIALALAAARAPLSAHWTGNTESLAIYEMAIIQIVALGMLFPFLLRSHQSAAAVIVSAAPFLILASLLAEVRLAIPMMVFGQMAWWGLALWIWRMAIPPRWHLMAVAIANVVTLGIPAIQYAHIEFGSGQRSELLLRTSPFESLITQITRQRFDPTLWLSLVAVTICGLLALAIQKIESRSRSVGKNPTSTTAR